MAIVLLILICAAPSVAIFGPPTKNFKGRVNFIQPTNFTILTDDSQFIRIMVASDRKVPTEVQVGILVEVKAVQGNDGRWYLDKFKKIGLTPGTEPQ